MGPKSGLMPSSKGDNNLILEIVRRLSQRVGGCILETMIIPETSSKTIETLVLSVHKPFRMVLYCCNHRNRPQMLFIKF